MNPVLTMNYRISFQGWLYNKMNHDLTLSWRNCVLLTEIKELGYKLQAINEDGTIKNSIGNKALMYEI